MTSSEPIRKLTDNQLKDFDTEFITGKKWDALKCELDRRGFKKKHFDFLDIGGGNGYFRLCSQILLQNIHHVLKNKELQRY